MNVYFRNDWEFKQGDKVLIVDSRHPGYGSRGEIMWFDDYYYLYGVHTSEGYMYGVQPNYLFRLRRHAKEGTISKIES